MTDSIDIAGALVRLRTTTAGDKAALVAIRAHDEVRRWWRGDDLEAEFDDDLTDEDVERLTIERLDGPIVGLIQFTEEDDPDYRHASIDIYVGPNHHRQGLASDAIATLTTYLLEHRGHHRLTIDPSADNAPAIACYEGVGFRRVGVMRAYERRADGSWGDGVLMEFVAEHGAGPR